MKKLINFLVGAIIGVIVLYIISFVLACIVTAIVVIVNRVFAYRKKHRRFTDWVYKRNRLFEEEIGSQVQFKRIFYYERTDKILNTVETKEEIMITPIQGRGNSDYYKAEAEEWFKYKQHHQSLIKKEVQQYYSAL